MIHNIDPTILTLGPLEIRWYGLMYIIAFFFTYYYLRTRIRHKKLELTEKELDNLLGNLVIAMIIGARLFYAIFYNPEYFIQHPWKIIAVWEGGLSFHGGFLGVFLAGWYFAKKKKIPVLRLADAFSVPLSLGSAFGRIGNFINGELYGIPTNLPWGIQFPGTNEPRHPTQIYESIYNVIIFLTLFFLRDKKFKDGTLFGIFMTLYTIFRFSVEFIKDLPNYGPLTMGQWLSIPLVIIGVLLIVRNFYIPKKAK